MWLIIIPIVISAISLMISLFSYLNSRKSLKIVKRENAPCLKIIQNLWTPKPRYELINESNSKLDSTPSPSYLMFIPSKLYYIFEGGNRYSNLILSPVSYDVIKEQIVGNQTKESIVTSYLPPAFYAKKGGREVIHGEIIKTKMGFDVYVDTLPFLVIASDIEYSYDKVRKRTILLSTPLTNTEMSETDINYLYEYITDNTDKLEVKLINNEHSVYQIAQNNVESIVQEIFSKENEKTDQELTKICGGKEGGYGFILKKINGLISPVDPIEDYIKNTK